MLLAEGKEILLTACAELVCLQFTYLRFQIRWSYIPYNCTVRTYWDNAFITLALFMDSTKEGEKKKKGYTAMAQSMKTNMQEECDLFQRWCIMKTVETYMNRTSLTAWLYHTNYIFGKFQSTELNGMNMLTGITSRREFYLLSTRKQKFWKTNKKSDWPSKILMGILLEGEDVGWEFFTN